MRAKTFKPENRKKVSSQQVGVNDDIDGDLHPLSAGYDVGVDEYLNGDYWRIYRPLVLR